MKSFIFLANIVLGRGLNDTDSKNVFQEGNCQHLYVLLRENSKDGTTIIGVVEMSIHNYHH
jgi:hypothetical protein